MSDRGWFKQKFKKFKKVFTFKKKFHYFPFIEQDSRDIQGIEIIKEYICPHFGTRLKVFETW